MTIDPIRILMGSDFHFGMPTISSLEMADAFASTIFPLLHETDIFFINGDFFETAVIFDNHGFDPIYETILGIFRICEAHKVRLRVLQGTWTHDRNQLKRFEAFYRNSGFSFDFKFVGTIDLETIQVRDRSLRVLYAPDDLPFKSSEDLMGVILEKLREVGWDYVDYACLHGFFDFTYPKNFSQDGHIVFREEQFRFVKKLVNVGHVHQYRNQGHVFSNGSFDRLNHGDEEPKGCIRVFDYPDHYTAQFVENKKAAIFNTIYFTKDDTTETIRREISTHLAKLSSERRIHLRFQIDTVEHRDAIRTWMTENHPTVKIVFKKNSEEDHKAMMIPLSGLLTPHAKRIAPTPKTIATFIRAHIPDEYVLTTEDIELHLEPTS